MSIISFLIDNIFSLSIIEESSEVDYNNIRIRFIISIISSIFCLIIIGIYLVLVYQVWSSNSKKEFTVNDSLANSSMEQNPNKGKSIGLGSHFMCLLILSNLGSCITSIVFYSYYQKVGKEIKQDDVYCDILGFFHNSFDLIAVCSTTIITSLFWFSTQNIQMLPEQESSRGLWGFIYSVIFPFFYCIIGLFFNSYGLAGTHCSFKYFKKNNFKLEDSNEGIIIGIYSVYSIFVFGNLAYNILAFVKAYCYYNAKLKLLKEQKVDEYNVMRWYVYLFLIFPSFLLISRSIRGINRLIYIIHTEREVKSNFQIFFEYAYSITFCLNGTLNSLLCAYFFRGVFINSDSQKSNRSSVNEAYLIPSLAEDNPEKAKEIEEKKIISENY